VAASNDNFACIDHQVAYIMMFAQRMNQIFILITQALMLLYVVPHICVLSVMHVLECSALSLFAFQFRLCSMEYMCVSCVEAWAGNLCAPTRSVGVPWCCRKDSASEKLLLIVLLTCSLRTDWIKKRFLFFNVLHLVWRCLQIAGWLQKLRKSMPRLWQLCSKGCTPKRIAASCVGWALKSSSKAAAIRDPQHQEFATPKYSQTACGFEFCTESESSISAFEDLRSKTCLCTLPLLQNLCLYLLNNVNPEGGCNISLES
jgi:hypothetical protein